MVNGSNRILFHCLDMDGNLHICKTKSLEVMLMFINGLHGDRSSMTTVLTSYRYVWLGARSEGTGTGASVSVVHLLY